MKDNAKAESSILREVLRELEKIETYSWATPFSVINSVAQLRHQVSDAIEFNKTSLLAPSKKIATLVTPKSDHAVHIEGNEGVYIPGGISSSPITISKT